MISKVLIRSELHERCLTLRNNLGTNLDKLDARALQQRLGTAKLLNAFEMLCEWYLTAIDSNPLKTDRDLSIASKTLYDEFEQIRLIVTDILSSALFPGLPLLNIFVKSVIDSLNNNFFKIPETIFIQEGDKFSLTRFYYCPDDVARLYLPGDALSQPWRWSMIWHEMGNLLVFPIVTVQRVVRIGDRDSEPEWVKVYNSIRKLINEFIDDHIDTDDLLQDALLEAVIPIIWSSTRPDRRMRLKEEILHKWIEELLEDSVTILVLGDTGFFSLVEALDEFYQDPIVMNEKRHPPPLLRLVTAKLLLNLTNTKGVLLNEVANKLQEIILQLSADDINRIVPLIEELAKTLSNWIHTRLHLVDDDKLWINNESPISDTKGLGAQNLAIDSLSAQNLVKEAIKQRGEIAKKGAIEWFREKLPPPIFEVRLPQQQLGAIQKLRSELERVIPDFSPEDAVYKKQISDVLYYNYTDLKNVQQTKKAANPDELDTLDIDQIASEFLNETEEGGLFKKLALNQLKILAFSFDDPNNVLCAGCDPNSRNCVNICSRRCCLR